MMKSKYVIFTLIVFLIGCTHLGLSKSIDLEKDISLMMLSPQIHYVKIYKVDDFIYVTGTVNKTLGKDLGRRKVYVAFLDDKSSVLVELQVSISPRRTRLNRGRTGRFLARISYDPNIKQCNLRIE